MENLKVAIIGAGPAGCMLARLLHLGGLKVTIFEGEASPNFRSQGGTLDLHDRSGLAAIREAGLWDEFTKYARYDGQYMAIVDKNLHYYIVRGADDKSAFGERPEIDRVRLREILIDSLPEGTIKWGHRLQNVEGKILVFSNGTSESDFDLIVGADGAWSKIRKAIAPKLQPEYSGVAMHNLIIPDAQTTAPEVYKLVNRGSIFASADGQRVSIQQIGDDSLEIYASFVHKDPDWMKPEKCGYNAEDLAETKAALAKEFSDWYPQLRDAFDRAQGRSIPRSLYLLPAGSTWEHKSGFTLIGDAAHLMTPHAGEGVNQALEDAMILAKVILEAKTAEELDGQIRSFEENMSVRVGKVQQLAYDLCQDWLFTPGAPQTSIAIAMSRHQKNAKSEAEIQARAEAIKYAMAKAQEKNQA